DAAMAAAVKGGLLAVTGLLVNATAPVAGQVLGGVLGGGIGGLALGTIAGGVAMAGLIIYMILGGILIAELVYILVLKAIQTALLTAQYMFAPIFLVFFATPDTESVTSGFVKSFVEVSLWTFVWVGLLKIMVIIILSEFNPWGKIVMAVGVLQLMIQVPSFLARAQISPVSDFVSAGLVTGGLMKGGKALGDMLGSRSKQLAGFIGGSSDTGAAPGPQQSQKETLNGLPNGVANQEMLGKFNNVSKGGDPNDPKNKGPGGGPELDANGKPIDPNKPKPDPNAPKPPKKDDPNAKKDTNNPIDPATGKPVNKATDTLGTGVTPGSESTSDAAKAAALNAAKKGATTAAVASAVGTVMAAGGAASALNNQTQPPTKESSEAKEARQAAEQLAFDFKGEQNLQNAGVKPEGAEKDADGNALSNGAEQSVKGKVLDTTRDKGDAKGKGDDKKAVDGKDKMAGALASQILPAAAQGKKQDEKGKGKGADTPVDRSINPIDKDKRGEKSVQGELFNPKDLAALGKEGVAGAVADAITGDADAKAINMDLDQEVANQGEGSASGNLTPGKTVVGKLVSSAAAGDKGTAKDIKGTVPGVVTGKPGGNPTLNLGGSVNPAKPGSLNKAGGPGAKDASSAQLDQVTSEPHMGVVDPTTGIGTDEEVKGPDLAVTAVPLKNAGRGLAITVDPKALVPGGKGGVSTSGKGAVAGSVKTETSENSSGAPQLKTDVRGQIINQGGGNKPAQEVAASLGTPQALAAGMAADADALPDGATLTAEGKIVEKSGQMRFNFGPT
ncbi:MAG: hypothetical protein K8F91_06745, partial [Candidatus Obscuribacterales bacterium]|nr:hypothetical protein [Candidatus Obscuribacterales bacterium]